MTMSRIRWTTFAAPSRFEALAAAVTPWLWAVCLLASAVGLYLGFIVAPKDFQQGQSYRIIFIHVPAAWMSMVLYLAMATWAAIGWAWRVRLASMLARAIAPTGAMFTFVALWTGAFWGKPTWGTWWGVGCAPDFRAHLAVPVPGLHGPGRGHRRPAAR